MEEGQPSSPAGSVTPVITPPLASRPTWSSLLKNTANTGFTPLTYYSESRGKEIVIIEDEDIVDELRYWKNSVVCYVLGSKPYFPYFKAYVQKRWHKDAVVVSLKDGFFQGRAIIVKKWHKSIQLERDIMAIVPIWMKVCDLPVHARSGTSISKIVSNIAKPLYMEDVIQSREKGLYVHVLAEMEVDGVFPEIIQTRLHGLPCRAKVEYEWKPQVCKTCKKMDHTDAMCPSNKVRTIKPREHWVVKKKSVKQGDLVSIQAVDVPNDAQEDMEGFTVQKKSKGKLKMGEPVIPTPVVSVNAFQVLDDNTETEEVLQIVEIYNETLNHDLGSPVIDPLKDVVDSQEVVLETQDQCGWDPMKVEVMVITSTDQMILLHVVIRGTNSRLFVSFIYAKNTDGERQKLWQDLVDCEQKVDGPWLLLGDWNIVRFNSEKKGGRIHPPRVFADFNNTIDKLCLTDVPTANGLYT
ncbi:uncharacterized protein LOC132270348 [Cornus florida]|uniref:uncharacterized protein LOC132270348 n=1 Tax=Cornus florida TaxID=4283 RepID=UPI00289D8BA2|nr:uncharacterized protein LOC132270348 [Cornus florida]